MTDKRWRWQPRIIYLLVLIIGLTLHVFGRAQAADLQVCVDAEPSNSAHNQSTCEALAQRWRNQPSAVLDYGEQMIARGSTNSAQAVYLAYLAEHPDAVSVMKALIRARAHARLQQDREGHRTASTVVSQHSDHNARRAPVPAAPPPEQKAGTDADTALQSQCWRGRWQTALQSCRKIIALHGPTARLLERSADLHRSLGDGHTALAMYQRSLAIDPAAATVQRKYRALARMLDGYAETANLNNEQVRVSRVTQTSTTTGRPVNSIRAVAAHRKLALVVGIDRYADFEPLQTARNDARLIASVLKEQYGFEVTTLLDARRSQVMSALSRLRQRATARDDVLIYYAGHGYLDDRTGRGYWLPVDAQPNEATNWLSNGDVTDTMAGLLARSAIVIADSCFAGSLIASTATEMAPTDPKQRRRGALPGSRTVMTSGGLEPVLDNGSGQHSVFARALARALRHNKREISASALFNSVRNTVIAQAAQTPQYSPMNLPRHRGGDFIFVARH